MHSGLHAGGELMPDWWEWTHFVALERNGSPRWLQAPNGKNASMHAFALVYEMAKRENDPGRILTVPPLV